MSNDFFQAMMDSQKQMMDSWNELYKNVLNPEENPYKKSIDDFYELQKQYIDALSTGNTANMTKLFTDFFKNQALDPKAFEFFNDMQKYYMEMMKKYTPGTDFPFMNMDKWMSSQEGIHEYFDKVRKYYNPLEMGKAFTPVVKDLLENMMQANTYYLNIYKFWKELESFQLFPPMEDLKKYTSMLTEKYDIMFKEMVLPMLPKEFQSFAKDPMELAKLYMKTNGDFLEPWANNGKQLRDLFIEGVLNDKAKLGEFFELWKSQFDKTFGAILLSPSMGLNKELIEQQSKTFDTFIDLVLLSADFTSRIYAVQNENMDDMVRKYFEMAEQNTQPKTFHEFFTYWSNELERIFDSYFATPEYSKLLGQLSSVAMDYKIEMQKLVEKYLTDTPIVTRTEINSLYKTIYDLKKEVKTLKKSQKSSVNPTEE